MIYLEELTPGSMFVYMSAYWILTSDFKKNGDRMCVATADGFPNWFAPNISVTAVDAYVLDSNNNIIKVRNNENSSDHNI